MTDVFLGPGNVSAVGKSAKNDYNNFSRSISGTTSLETNFSNDRGLTVVVLPLSAKCQRGILLISTKLKFACLYCAYWLCKLLLVIFIKVV